MDGYVIFVCETTAAVMRKGLRKILQRCNERSEMGRSCIPSKFKLVLCLTSPQASQVQQRKARTTNSLGGEWVVRVVELADQDDKHNPNLKPTPNPTIYHWLPTSLVLAISQTLAFAFYGGQT